MQIKKGEIYRHFKGKEVIILELGKDSENLEDLVIYKHIDEDTIWVRELSMFLSPVDHEKYPEINQKKRFEFVK